MSAVFQIANCNNIEQARIEIEVGQLNIKYGFNGIGKSTIANAIKSYINGDSLDSLAPYGGERTPSVEGSEPFEHVEIFNTEFINNFAFEGSEAISDAFQIFVRTAEYETAKKDLEKRLSSINTLLQSSSISALKDSLSAYGAVGLKRDARGNLKRDAKLKALTQPYNQYVVDPRLSRFQPVIEVQTGIAAWAQWHKNGLQFVSDIKLCPFCAEKLNAVFEDECHALNEHYQKAQIENNEKAKDAFDGFGVFLSDSGRKDLDSCITEKTSDAITTLNLCVQ